MTGRRGANFVRLGIHVSAFGKVDQTLSAWQKLEGLVDVFLYALTVTLQVLFFGALSGASKIKLSSIGSVYSGRGFFFGKVEFAGMNLRV